MAGGKYSLFVWVPLALAVAACDFQDVSNSETAEMTAPTKNKVPVQRLKLDATMQALVDVALTDLASRLKQEQSDAGNIVVLRAERVTWRSGALGCPKPDRVYKMALVPGVLIQLRVGASSYEYHSTPAGPPFLCEPPGRIETPAPGRTSLDPT
ncbi:MAG: hypothetical protein ABJ308_07280 [Halieaceae bacterium]